MSVPTASPPRRSHSALFVSLLVLAVLAGGGWFWSKHRQSHAENPRKPGGGAGLPVPVVAGVVEQKQVPIYLDGLGTVQAFNTVTVRSRVDGQVQRIAFTEGQDVRSGDLLAQIDPAPFQAALDQATAKRAQDEAQLAVAKITLSRDKELLEGKILSRQEYDTQQALVDQLDATVKGDQAAIDNARVQLGYTKITSPLDGRTGIRQVDQGNIVHENDSNGIVVITQLRPISVVFTLPEQNLNLVQEHFGKGEALTTLAVDRNNDLTLGQGKLAVIDNQIDTSTGTIRLKSTFANDDLKLWPGQFVNVRLLLTTRTGPVVPASVVQRGPDGPFAFVISNDVAVVRPIKLVQVEGNLALLESGLVPGERVVVDGQYKLQAGSRIKPAMEQKPAKPDSKGQGQEAMPTPSSRLQKRQDDTGVDSAASGRSRKSHVVAPDLRRRTPSFIPVRLLTSAAT